MLGIGSGYRPYEFVGLGKDFEGRRDMVEEAVGLMFDAFHRHRYDHKGRYFSGTVAEPYELLPQPVQMPHPPLYMAGGTDRSITTQSMFWQTLLPEQKLEMDAVHTFTDGIARLGPITHVRFNVFPDGGVSRLRLWGRVEPK